jgi:hypothetical protein
MTQIIKCFLSLIAMLLVLALFIRFLRFAAHRNLKLPVIYLGIGGLSGLFVFLVGLIQVWPDKALIIRIGLGGFLTAIWGFICLLLFMPTIIHLNKR